MKDKRIRFLKKLMALPVPEYHLQVNPMPHCWQKQGLSRRLAPKLIGVIENLCFNSGLRVKCSADPEVGR
jgi:hypothetical protein